MKAEVSIPVALATSAMVVGIYYAALPTVADARAVGPDNPDLAKAERTALLLSVAAAAGVSLVSRDSTPFVFGGLVAVALSWWHRSANMTDPTTQTIFNRDRFNARRYTVEASG
jgi:type IV secretory pathway TrbD component